MALDLILNLVNSIIRLLLLSLLLFVPVTVFALIVSFLKKKLQEKYSFSWMYATSISTLILMIVFTVTFYFGFYFSIVSEVNLGQIRPELASQEYPLLPQFLFTAESPVISFLFFYLLLFLKRIIVALVLTGLILPLQFIGSLVLNYLNQRFEKTNFLIKFGLTCFAVSFLTVLILLLFDWILAGIIYFVLLY